MELRRTDWVFPPEASSVSAARTAVTEQLQGLSTDSAEVVRVLISELVTNAVLHGVGPVGVHLAWDDRVIRVEVADESPLWPVVQAADRDAVRGRGLMIVEALSAAWGVERNDVGKTVWFTVGV